MKCANNLKQLGLACHNYHETRGHLPPGFESNRPPPAPGNSWCRSNTGNSRQGPPFTVILLPYLEQDNQHKAFDFSLPFQETSNQMLPAQEAVLLPLKALQCPSDNRFQSNQKLNSYYGVQGGGTAIECQNTGCTPTTARAWWSNGLLHAGSKIALNTVRDGTTNVFMIGESRYGSAAWGASAKQDSCAYVRNLAGTMEQINLYPNTGVHETRGFSSFHTGGAHFCMGDGSTHFIRDTIDLAVYQQLGQRDDGRPVGGFEK